MRRGVWILVLLVLFLLLSGRGDAATFSRYTQNYFGTASMLFLYETEGAQETWEAVKELLEAIDGAVSISREDSDLARFNTLAAGEGMPVSDLTADILSVAFRAWEMTGGLYDPTVFPLVDLWGFSPRFNRNTYRQEMPYDRPLMDGHPTPASGEDVAALLPLVGLGKISLVREENGWMLYKHTPPLEIGGMLMQAQIDLGGLAKGYACDCVIRLLQERGYTEGYFVCGGSSMAFLKRPEGRAFTVSAGKPRGGEGKTYAQVQAMNTTLSSSADYSHSYTAEDVLYCHIMDPRTGYPMNMPGLGIPQAGVATVTLLGESAALNDALSTALCLMGPEDALEFLRGRNEQMVMAVYRTGEDRLEVVSNMSAEQVEILDEQYVWACGEDAEGHSIYTGTLVP